MELLSLINRTPLPVLFLLTLVFVLLTLGAGMRLGGWVLKHSVGVETVGSVVTATLAMLAFMLAFTFNMAANRFDVRKQLLLEEVNSIGTTYLRAGLLPPPYETDIRKLLREYVDLRVSLLQGELAMADTIVKSEVIQEEIWLQVEKMLGTRSASISQGLFIQSLNEMIDLQTKRVTVGLQFRVPDTIWIALYVILGLAMVTVGYQFGRPHERHFPANVMLALAFSSVILLIADLDRASEGTVTLNPQAVYDLQQRIK